MTSPEPPTSGSTADAAAVWNSQKATYVAANSFGKITQDIETDVSTVDGKVDTVDTNVDSVLVDTGTTLPAEHTNIETKVDTVDGVVDSIVVDTSNSWLKKVFWSEAQATAPITGGSTDVSLPSVVIPNEIDISTIKKVLCILKFRKIDNSDAASNAINGAADVQVKESVGGAYTDCIDLANNLWDTDGTAESGGDMMVGDIDVSAEVSLVNLTYNFQFDDIQADNNNLTLHDVQTGIIIYYTV